MATLVLTLSAQEQTRVVNAITNIEGYVAIIDGVPNPETKAQFIQKIIVRFLKDYVKKYERQENQKNMEATFESGYAEPVIT